jgi:hypothetical protein
MTTMTKLAWILAAMQFLLPRYMKPSQTIAQAIETAATESPVFKGEDGWKLTAATMIGVSYHESGFRQLHGDCKGLPPGDPRCGKEGTTPTSFCFMQVHLPDGARTKEGWTGEDLMTDPLKCARAGRNALLASIKESPVDEPLLRYAGGDTRMARTRWQAAKRLVHQLPYASAVDTAHDPG